MELISQLASQHQYECHTWSCSSGRGRAAAVEKKKNSRICLSSSLRHKTGVLTFFWFNPSCTSAGEPPRTGTQEVLEVKVPVSAGASSSWRLAAQTEQSQAEPDDCRRAVDTKNSETFIHYKGSIWMGCSVWEGAVPQHRHWSSREETDAAAELFVFSVWSV